MKWIFLTLLLVSPAVAPGEESAGSAPPASCFAMPHKWAYDRTHEDLAEPGQRFLADMHDCAPTFAASVEEAVRYQIHDAEAKKFARNQKFMMTAYGVAWALLAVAAVALVFRQRKLSAQIAELETKLREAGAKP